MINRRALLLGGVGMGMLGLTGCGVIANFGPTGGHKRPEPPHTKGSVHKGFTYGVPTHLYYDENTLAFFMPYGEHFVATGDFNYYQLPDSLWRKAYFNSGIDITATYHKKTDKDIYEIRAYDKAFELIFIDNELNKQEKNLLQQLFGDKIKLRKGEDYKSIGMVKDLSNATVLWEIRVELPSMQLFGSERMVHLFNKESDFEIICTNYHFYWSAKERYDTWLANNPTPLRYQSDGSLLYNGKRLTKRLDKMVRMAHNHLREPFV